MNSQIGMMAKTRVAVFPRTLVSFDRIASINTTVFGFSMRNLILKARSCLILCTVLGPNNGTQITEEFRYFGSFSENMEITESDNSVIYPRSLRTEGSKS